MKKKILITGYSGLIAQHFIKQYDTEFEYLFLTTRKEACDQKSIFYWNPSKGEVDSEVIALADGVIHMSGYSIFKPWTTNNKQIMFDSRVKAAEILFNYFKNRERKLDFFISFSAIGWYGYKNTGIVDENSKSGHDFVADLCKEWERAALHFETIGTRVTITRISLVISKDGGFLSRMKPVFNIGFGSGLGNGKQPMPWIHIEDLSAFIFKAINQDNIKGVHNMVAPEKHTMNSFSKTLAKAMKKPFFMPNVPSFILKMIFGKRSTLLTDSPDVESIKIKESGFEFKYPELKEALKEACSKN